VAQKVTAKGGREPVASGLDPKLGKTPRHLSAPLDRGRIDSRISFDDLFDSILVEHSGLAQKKDRL